MLSLSPKWCLLLYFTSRGDTSMTNASGSWGEFCGLHLSIRLILVEEQECKTKLGAVVAIMHPIRRVRTSSGRPTDDARKWINVASTVNLFRSLPPSGVISLEKLYRTVAYIQANRRRGIREGEERDGGGGGRGRYGLLLPPSLAHIRDQPISPSAAHSARRDREREAE